MGIKDADISVSLICSTYESPRFLGIVLESVALQGFRDFELIVADDGSGAETRRVIAEFREKADFPVTHLWQEDRGFRKARIHNRAIERARGRLLVFIDGDCVLAPDFLQDHLSVLRENEDREHVFMGRRVLLGPELTRRVTRENFRKILFPTLSPRLIWSALKRDSTYVSLKHSPKNPHLRRLLGAERVPDLIGCNFSLRRRTMLKINGFNEDFEGYGLEDFDIFLRLRNLGCRIVGRRYFAVQYHLFHPRPVNTDRNIELYESLLEDENYTRAARGISTDKAFGKMPGDSVSLSKDRL